MIHRDGGTEGDKKILSRLRMFSARLVIVSDLSRLASQSVLLPPFIYTTTPLRPQACLARNRTWLRTMRTFQYVAVSWTRGFLATATGTDGCSLALFFRDHAATFGVSIVNFVILSKLLVII